MKPYGKNGKQINCCPAHDSTSKQRAGKSNKKRARQASRRDLMDLSFSIPGVIGYKIYGIAPIPVQVKVGENVRIEPMSDGYNMYYE